MDLLLAANLELARERNEARAELREARREVGRLGLELEVERRLRAALEDVVRATAGVRDKA